MKKTQPSDTRLADVTKWDELEQRYRQNLYEGSGQPEEITELSDKNGLIFTAAHSLNHFRDGNVKLADRWTGSAAEILAAENDAGYIIPVGKISGWDDWSLRSDPFKSALERRAKPDVFFVDLHGMSNDHGVDLCIGLGPAPSATGRRFGELLTERMAQYEVSINTPFSGEPCYTVTSFIQTHTSADAIQLEISAQFRNPQDRSEPSMNFIRRLAEAFRGVPR